jgi:hypothetical protein
MLPTFTDPELPYDECVTTAFRSPTAAPLLLPVSTTSTVSLQDITDTVPREGVSATEMALFTLPKWLPVISMRLPAPLRAMTACDLANTDGVTADTIDTCAAAAITPRTDTFAHSAPALLFDIPATVTPNPVLLTDGLLVLTAAVIALPVVDTPA